VDYGGGLENRCRRKPTVGSNPTPSASWMRITIYYFIKLDRLYDNYASDYRY
jgi:hypothetical protein